VKLTLLLCDHAAVSEGKLYIHGGGWNLTGPDPAPCGIAVLIEVPWDQTNQAIAFRMRLVHEDGAPVTQLTPSGVQAIEVGANVEVGRPPGVLPGTALPVPLAINLPPLALPAGRGYVWVAEVAGVQHEDWRLPFRTRPAPKAPTDPTALPDLS
jgi:hypothetical protein